MAIPENAGQAPRPERGRRHFEAEVAGHTRSPQAPARGTRRDGVERDDEGQGGAPASRQTPAVQPTTAVHAVPGILWALASTRLHPATGHSRGHSNERAIAHNAERTTSSALALFDDKPFESNDLRYSGRVDLNHRPLDPQSSALDQAELRPGVCPDSGGSWPSSVARGSPCQDGMVADRGGPVKPVGPFLPETPPHRQCSHER